MLLYNVMCGLVEVCNNDEHLTKTQVAALKAILAKEGKELLLPKPKEDKKVLPAEDICSAF